MPTISTLVIDVQRDCSSERSLGGDSSIGTNSNRKGCFRSIEKVPARSPLSSWQRSGPEFGGQKSASDPAARSTFCRNMIFLVMSLPYCLLHSASLSRAAFSFPLARISIYSPFGNSVSPTGVTYWVINMFDDPGRQEGTPWDFGAKCRIHPIAHLLGNGHLSAVPMKGDRYRSCGFNCAIGAK